MANPTAVPCTADTWTLVAEDVQSCVIHMLKTSPERYYHTYVVANDTAPSGVPSASNKAARWLDPTLLCSFNEDCDVYIYAKGAAGSVRVDA